MPDYHVIPSIEQLRQRPALGALQARYGREATVGALRDEASALRARLAADAPDALPADAAVAAALIESAVERRLRETYRGSLRPVVNATGVVIHTNLGRAPLAAGAIERLVAVARGYSNLEFDLETGRRGRRDVHASALLARLTGAESALVVNNNAAATMLILSALAFGREVVISRGELVEIGGGFRVPEIMAQSGAILREVGTTNKTRVADYQAAIGERTALILRVHRSNFRIEGFTEQPSLDSLVALGRSAGVPVVEDLGSGWLPDAAGSETAADALRDEPDVRASLRAGLDLVCVSGDKLLGGPQAGLIVGRAALVDRLRTHPLVRALRVDKLTYAALEGTLLEYLAGRAATAVPVVRMLAMSASEVDETARAVVAAVGRQPRFDVKVCDGVSMVGGGSAPGLPIATRLVALRPKDGNAGRLETTLREADPPVIARVEQNTVLLDLRTVQPEQVDTLIGVLREVGAGR